VSAIDEQLNNRIAAAIAAARLGLSGKLLLLTYSLVMIAGF